MKKFNGNKMTRRGVLGLLLGGGASAAFADPVVRSPFPLSRPEDLFLRAIPSGDAIVAQAGLSGVTSYALADVKSGEFLEVRGPLRRLPPASVAKTITALYALETLGENHRFETRLRATGAIENGRIQGDLILEGGGDPTLDTDMIGALAGQLRDLGVTGITGRFLIWDKALPRVEEIDHAQTEYAGYNPTISGLNLNYNRVHFEWRKSGETYALKMDARAEKFAPDVKISRVKIAQRDLPVFDHEAGQNRDEWTVARSALGKGGSRWLPVRLPALYAAEVFSTIAASKGLRLPKPERIDTMPQATVLATHHSEILRDLLRDMLKYSTNLTAEIMGLSATIARGGDAHDLQTSAEAMNQWAMRRLGMRHMDFVDHSGLGGASHVSTNDMVRMLSAQGVADRLSPILKVIEMRDEQRNVIADSPLGVVAKTGTLDFVSTLAGYVVGENGRPLAFAIFAADIPARQAAKARGDAVPKGARTFNTRAKKMQQKLLQSWGVLHGHARISAPAVTAQNEIPLQNL